MPAQDTANRVFREFRRFSGDGLPGEPVNAPLPVGDPQSGPHNPKKAEIREALVGVLADAHEALDRAEELEAKLNIPDIGSGDGGKILHVLPDGSGYGLREEQQINYEIGDGSIALAKLINFPAGRVLGRAAGAGSGPPQLLTFDQVYTPPDVVPGSSQVLSPRMFGAVGNGDPANAAADTSGFIAAMNKLIDDAPGGLPNRAGPYMTLDLQGGSYFLDKGFVSTQTKSIGRVHITNGLLQFKDGTAAGTHIFIDLSSLSMLYGCQFSNLWLNGFNTSNQTIAKGGIKLPNARVVGISKCYINGFTDKGIHGVNSDFGQAINIEFCHIQGIVGGTMPGSNTAIHLEGGDNKVFGCYVGEANRLIYFGKGSNSVALCHLFNFTYTSIDGIYCNEADKMMITDNYIDTVRVSLRGFASGQPSHFWGNTIVGNKFYIPPTWVNAPAGSFTGSTAMIVYIPRAANSIVDNDAIVANTFTCENGNFPPSIAVNTANGTIGTVSETDILHNRHYGFTKKTTEPTCTLRFNNANTVTKSLASQVPFGAVRFVKSYAVETATYKVEGYTFSPQVGDNNVTAYTVTSTTSRVRVVASINAPDPD